MTHGRFSLSPQGDGNEYEAEPALISSITITPHNEPNDVHYMPNFDQPDGCSPPPGIAVRAAACAPPPGNVPYATTDSSLRHAQRCHKWSAVPISPSGPSPPPTNCTLVRRSSCPLSPLPALDPRSLDRRRSPRGGRRAAPAGTHGSVRQTGARGPRPRVSPTPGRHSFSWIRLHPP